MVEYIGYRFYVMYLVKIVEIVNKYDLYSNPMYLYTKVLLSAVPVADPLTKKIGSLKKAIFQSMLHNLMVATFTKGTLNVRRFKNYVGYSWKPLQCSGTLLRDIFARAKWSSVNCL